MPYSKHDFPRPGSSTSLISRSTYYPTSGERWLRQRQETFTHGRLFVQSIRRPAIASSLKSYQIAWSAHRERCCLIVSNSRDGRFDVSDIRCGQFRGSDCGALGLADERENEPRKLSFTRKKGCERYNSGCMHSKKLMKCFGIVWAINSFPRRDVGLSAAAD